AIRKYLAPDAVGHTEGGDMVGPEAFIELFHRPFLVAFPDVKVTVDEVLAMECDAVVRWTAVGINTGEAFGMPPTGRKVTIHGMSWLKFRDGLLVEGWDHWNFSGLMGALTGGPGTATIVVEDVV
ncbi:MAG: ester cyclase, partial [Verrucomicrobium sp.]